jgi:uncharacterized protein YbaR (Trm112 family)
LPSIHMHNGAINARASMVNPELLAILVCPETKQRLSPAGDDILERVNQAVEEGYLRNQEGLIREDGKVMYPVWDDIPVMLLDEAIRLDTLR